MRLQKTLFSGTSAKPKPCTSGGSPVLLLRARFTTGSQLSAKSVERGCPDFAVVLGACDAVVPASKRPSGLAVCPMRWRSILYPTLLESASGRSDRGGGGFGGGCFAVVSTRGLSGSAIRAGGSAIRADEGAHLRAAVLGCVWEAFGGETARPGQGGRCMSNLLGLMSSVNQ